MKIKAMFKQIVTCIIISLSFFCIQLQAELLTADGKPFRSIIIQKGAPGSVVQAAKDLRKYVKAVCNTNLPIIEQGQSEAQTPAFFLGTATKIKTADLKDDGFRIQSSPDGLLIAGKDDPEKPIIGIRNPWNYREVWNPQLRFGAFGNCGTMYGVYRFLEQYLGIRWYMPGPLGEVVPPRKNITLPAIDLNVAPVISYRYVWMCNFAVSPRDALWYRRSGFGGRYPVQIIDSFALFLKYKDSHPEYFALVDGKRDFTNRCASRGGGHLCLSNPVVVKQWAKDITAYFKSHPEAGIFPVVPNDGLSRICECPDCQADLTPGTPKSGRFSNHIWKFVAKVAKEVAKTCPGKYLGCLAYEGYSDPPTALDRLPENVVVMLCKAEHMNYPCSTGYRGKATEWLKKTNRIYFWDYYLYHWKPWCNLPIFYGDFIADDIKYLVSIHSPGEFIEAENFGNTNQIKYPGMQHLNLYLTGKLMWNPDVDFSSMLEEYYRLFYGPASEPMRKFWTIAADSLKKTPSKNKKIVPADIFTRPVLDQLSRALAQAQKAVPQDSIYAKRIKVIVKEYNIGRRSLVRQARTERPVITATYLQNPRNILKCKPQQFVDKSGESSQVSTWVYAGWRSNNLYLSFICFESHMNKLKKYKPERDHDGIWNEDSIEIFLNPKPGDKSCYRQFIVNSDGTCWDANIGGGGVRPEWNSGFKARVRKEPNRWIVNTIIPLKDLGINGSPDGITLGANFFRNRFAGTESDITCWAPVFNERNFMPKYFGKIILKK